MTSFETQYLVTQYGLLATTVFFYWKLVTNDNAREKRSSNAAIRNWCKCVFRAGSGSPGALQRSGQTVRERFPDRLNLILTAYEELRVEDPNLKLPVLYKFLESMDGIERDKWPSSGLAMSGKLQFWED